MAESADRICIRGVTFFAHHGVYEEEQKQGQEFVLDAVLYTDLEKAGESDRLEDTTDYGAVALFMVDFLQKNTYRLLEAASLQVLRATLLAFPGISRIDLVLGKPQAPIPLSFQTVEVHTSLAWHTAYIGLGANLGDKQSTLENAIEKIGSHPLTGEKRVSGLICTKPYGGVEQDDFLNGVMQIKTLLSPEALLSFLQSLEKEAHREKTFRWGPRTLDLDILFYDDAVISKPELTIPHADLQNRSFVLDPLYELAPFLCHPVLHKTVEQMRRELSEKEN
ncbi:MAG: 2-amino-4-hydroxy-6-hydroxymethyldihydropteridine diphosphokinase [Lachnospiraceae bacterium]|nr:2-amino-4-hydroxy-6-hydroxymethyldihydropteridine diphosphokinase [Lachnospiraceae bacterium]